MLACHFIDPDLKVEKGDNKIRGHWFWNGGLKHLLHTSTWHSGKFKQSMSAFFSNKKEKLLNVRLNCTFMAWLLDSLDQPR